MPRISVSPVLADTEIDWVAYMQEVGGWVKGELDYANLRGDTGPLVYPAGFLYIFRAFRTWTGNGGLGATAVRSAQWLFWGMYLLNLSLVLRIYEWTRYD
jgi:alpha-1,3-mannosyltransferase